MIYIYVFVGRLLSEEARATRVLSFCKLIQNTNNRVLVISLDKKEAGKIHKYQGIEFMTLRTKSESFYARLMNYIAHKRRLAKILHDIEARIGIKGFFFYDIPPHSVNFLKTVSSKQNKKIFHDSVEWYSSSQFRWRSFALPFILKNLLNSFLIDKNISVIAISTFLENYYQQKGIKCTRIPVLMEMKKIPFYSKQPTEKLKLLYAGSPGKKDFLNEVIGAIASLDSKELRSIELVLLGVTEEELTKVCGISPKTIQQCGNSLAPKGKVSRSTVLSYLEKTDFTVLLRPSNLRYSKAGFPTKVVESLATGTPVICNLSSDLGLYLNNQQNCFLVDSCTTEAFQDILRKTMKLTKQEKIILSVNARKTAEVFFDTNNYTEQFKSFICEN